MSPFKEGSACADMVPMSTIPSIKGSVVLGHVELLSRLVSSGDLSRSELESRLLPEDLALLDEPISVGGWYDVRSYARVLELLRDVAGGGSNVYLLDRGAATAERLLYSGLYQQFEYLKRTQMAAKDDARERFLAFGRDLRLISTLSRSILNFSRQQVREDPEHSDRWLLETSEAAAYPEVLCWSSQGFFNRMAQEHGCPELWRWERPQDDLIYFRMTYTV